MGKLHFLKHKKKSGQLFSETQKRVGWSISCETNLKTTGSPSCPIGVGVWVVIGCLFPAPSAPLLSPSQASCRAAVAAQAAAGLTLRGLPVADVNGRYTQSRTAPWLNDRPHYELEVHVRGNVRGHVYHLCCTLNGEWRLQVCGGGGHLICLFFYLFFVYYYL